MRETCNPSYLEVYLTISVWNILCSFCAIRSRFCSLFHHLNPCNSLYYIHHHKPCSVNSKVSTWKSPFVSFLKRHCLFCHTVWIYARITGKTEL